MNMIMPAAFGRLCVETRHLSNQNNINPCQPPSGGCVLKHSNKSLFRMELAQPPSGGCVLKPMLYQGLFLRYNQPPSGGCVLKQTHLAFFRSVLSSRLRAAVC